MKRISARSKSTHTRQLSRELQHRDLEEDEPILDESQADSLEHSVHSSDDEYAEEKGVKKNFNFDDEDVLIQTVLKHYDVVENKSTDKHLTSKQLETKQLDAWNAIRDEFVQNTKVSFNIISIV